MKNSKILVTILALAAALSIVFYVFSTNYEGHSSEEETTVDVLSNYSFDGSKYTAAITKSGTVDLPLMPTDIEGIYYVMNALGEVTYYTVANGTPTAYTGTVSTVESTITCSYQDIPVTLYCIEQDSKVCGYGLFTTANNTAVRIFDYAFFKVTSMPSAYGEGSMILVNFDKTAFASDNKIFSEAFEFSVGSGKQGDSVFTSNGRITGENGAFRNDWTMLTDDFMLSLVSEPYFVTGREYNLDQYKIKSDIMKRNGSSKSKTIVSEILGTWARATQDDSLVYLRATETGFECVSTSSEVPIKTFTGDYFTEYMHCGNYVFNRATSTLTNLLTGADSVIGNVVFSGSIMYFSVSPDGKSAVFASGENIAALQTIAVCNLETGTTEAYNEPLLFSTEYPEFTWLDNSSFMHTRPATADGTGLQYVIYTRKG